VQLLRFLPNYFFLPTLVWPLLPTHCRCRGFLLNLITLSDTHTLGRISLDVRSARRRDLHLTKHNTHNKQTPVPPAGFEPTISAGRATSDPHLRPRGHRNRPQFLIPFQTRAYYSTLRNAHICTNLSKNPQISDLKSRQNYAW
jgi:hypothetical protein